MIDDDIREVWKSNALRLGLKIVYGAVPQQVEEITGALRYKMTLNDSPCTVIESDFILYAAGRSANISELNLACAGVQLDKHGFIAVDEEQKTNIPNIFALGDVTSRPQLTPLAIKTGRTWAEYYYGGRKDCKTDFESVPTVVFSHPPLATIGLLEAAARLK